MKLVHTSLVVFLFITNSSFAEEYTGQQKAETCLGCHAIEGYNNTYPTYKVPKLGGQHSEYIISALKAYREGDRNHETMHANASALTDQDIIDIAKYFESIE